ncbi:pyruvate dehydrogenase (acetyl-transferring) E1 component subunit alpha [Agrococcus sp. SGAir0287]|nr:pyruvate dehydrogenase (acetyl-transferring) E1 component subunit alpha [Agrococcus sp. SGAir0287]
MALADLDEPLRLLDADGALVHGAETERWHALADALTLEDRIAMQRAMVVTRAVDMEARNLQRQGRLGLWVPSVGQEGGQVGMAFAMRDQDTVFPSYREHVIAHVRGVEWMQIVDVFRGARHGGWDPAATRGCRIYSLVIATQSLHATGYAMGVTMDGAVGTGDVERDEAVLVCYGDGATSQGDASESLVFSSTFDAPLVTYVQDNKWAISVPSRVQSRTPLHLRARGFGHRAHWIDGNDPLIAFAVGRAELDAARAGSGPGYVVADTYRMGAHTTSDDPTRYRSSEEEAAWQRRDPIARLAAHLRAQGVEDALLRNIDEEAADTAADVRRRTLEASSPPSDVIFDHVYTDPHEPLAQQKLALAEFEATFGGDA